MPMFKKKNSTLKDIFNVSVSNITILLSGVLVGFLLPKIIGVTDYGYYKTYTLYATYVGMFHFGISDGIYLKYGGKDYETLDRDKFRYYSRTFMLIEAIIAVALAFFSALAFENEYRFIFLFLSIYLLFHNITSYYQSISQATSRFDELSGRNILQSVLISIAVIGLWIVHRYIGTELTYRSYIILYSFIIVALALWYMSTYRDITFGKSSIAGSTRKDIPYFIRIGFPLMLANLCSSLILTLDRQFVNILYDTDTYAIYAFAYNMLSLVTTATSAIATVLYPNLRRTEESKLKKQYSSLVGVILCVVFACLIIYFPLNLFVKWFLPKYIDSLEIFRVIFPGLAISSAITIVMHNYYKTLGINFKFFIKTVITLAVSAAANVVAYYTVGTTVSISWASIITMIFWYILVEVYFVRNYKIRWIRNFSYMIIMMITFYVITMIQNQWIGMGIYFVAFVLFTFLLLKEEVKKLLRRL